MRRLLAVLSLLIPFLLGVHPDLDAGQDRDRTAPFTRQGDYVDDAELCADCHDQDRELILAGSHARVPQLATLHRCETCHGPGKDHVDSEEAAKITHPRKLSFDAQRGLCEGCHRFDLADHGGPLAVLAKAGKRCTDCHRVHRRKEAIPGREDPQVFRSRADLAAAAEPVGMDRCLTCHDDKRDNLGHGPHRTLVAGEDAQQSCEGCHGPGSRHVATEGVARLTTRPDRADDGIATCRSCHAEVDPSSFHWRDKDAPLLGAPPGGSLTCTSCHKVHDLAHVEAARRAPARPEAPASRPARDAAATAGAGTMTRAGGPATPAPGLDTSHDADLRPGACLACHAPAYDVLQGTIHEALVRWDAPAGTGCVSCHAGAGLHATSGGRRDLVDSLHGSRAEHQVATCNACHGRDHSTCDFAFGVHARHEVGCLACHSPAAPASAKGRRLDANHGCKDCHATADAAFRRHRGHPVGEGTFQCSSCHEPHRQAAVTMRNAWLTKESCTGCHREYRGPFVFAHHADKGEGCLACHVAHDNGHPKLLDTRRVRDNCLACHADLPSFHDQSAGSVYRDCLNCHVKIHGSNRNRFFLR
ncbi:MAG: cytochrome c3 family protein [Planctomycetota bacterium]